jgi:flagellar basal-body rod protein FlgB
MWFDKVTNTTNTAALEKVVQFTEARNKVLANNIANIDTPGYVMKDLDVSSFQKNLQEEISKKSVSATETTAHEDYDQYLLFHDKNNRSVEKQVTEMTKNAIMHNTAVELLRSRFALLEKAISLKP